MRTAFKEWAVVVDALGRGDQILILRKGGIHEGRGGFKMEHSEFLFFPTLFHQQRESVLPSAQARFDQIAPGLRPEKLRFEFGARVVEWHHLSSLAQAEKLRGQHIWRPEVIAQRCDWGRDKGIFAIAVRVFRLPQPHEVPMLPEYGGCKSWIELGEEIPVDGAQSVLPDEEFENRLRALREAVR